MQGETLGSLGAAQVKELQERLVDAHTQAQRMLEVMEARVHSQANAAAGVEAGLGRSLAACQE